MSRAEERVNKLMQENADLHKELEVLSGRLAAAPTALPMSPTTRPLELQMRYEETSRALQAEKSENRRLSNYLNQILKEIEDKARLMRRGDLACAVCCVLYVCTAPSVHHSCPCCAPPPNASPQAPLIQEQRVEYEKTLRRNERLASNLETAMSEIDALRTERATLQEERRTMQRECEDLSRQVQLLLRETQQMRDKYVALRVNNLSPLSACTLSIMRGCGRSP